MLEHSPATMDLPPARRPLMAWSPGRRIALVGNFLPRLCGLATFTTHLYNALGTLRPAPTVDVYAMVDPGRHYDFPPAVTMAIGQEDVDGYRDAARRIDASGADLVWVQHEYGIFGGPAGAYLLDLLDAVSAPVVATLHTVLEAPNDDQRRVLERLAERASLLVVMADHARTLLQRIYGVPPTKIAMIEHGVPDRGYVKPSAARQCFGVPDKKTIMTFGLLSPGKGIETMIRAMPAILDHCPEATYRIVGATHPHLVAQEGERYRDALQDLAHELGVDASLQWENRFLDEADLLNRLALADVYVTPYRNPQQITSGTLSYAAALGKPIVATPYVHATELLADGRGLLVGFDDADAVADAVSVLLTDDARRERMALRAHAHGRSLTWRNMAQRTLDRFDRRPSPMASDRRVEPCEALAN
jgi:glycosyltransferase involved in cell wall biosynthesis